MVLTSCLMGRSWPWTNRCVKGLRRVVVGETADIHTTEVLVLYTGARSRRDIDGSSMSDHPCDLSWRARASTAFELRWVGWEAFSQYAVQCGSQRWQLVNAMPSDWPLSQRMVWRWTKLAQINFMAWVRRGWS